MSLQNGLARPNTVAQPVSIGTFFAGDTGPTITMTLTLTGGGLINLLTDNQPTVIQVQVLRFDPRRLTAQGEVITSGIAMPLDQTIYEGQATLDWLLLAPVSHVPSELGAYIIQVQALFPDGHTQTIQPMIFDVVPGFR